MTCERFDHDAYEAQMAHYIYEALGLLLEDAKVYQQLCERFGFNQVLRILQNVTQATIRAMDRAATFEEANQDYDAMSGLVKKAGGDNAPLLLGEVVERADRLLLPAPCSEHEDTQ